MHYYHKNHSVNNGYSQFSHNIILCYSWLNIICGFYCIGLRINYSLRGYDVCIFIIYVHVIPILYTCRHKALLYCHYHYYYYYYYYYSLSWDFEGFFFYLLYCLIRIALSICIFLKQALIIYYYVYYSLSHF